MEESNSHRQPAQDTHLRYPLPTGTRVDHYVIREVLGAGGFGITYLAEHEALGKLYAIKEYFPHAFSVRQGSTVRPTSASDGTYKWGLERFVTEARALARFKHPAIVDVTSIFEANGTAYIVLAYEGGVDMSAWLKRLGRPPSQAELDRILTPLLGALEEVHRHNMMHRDISPDNLLIREDGRPVLIDFGSAREQIRGRARALSAIVKHGYSPPEQYTSKPELQGPWTDVYALSATLYRAISGKLPPDATERFIRDELAPMAVVARAAYRPSFLDAVDRGLKMKVEERPQTVVEWREMLFRSEPLREPPSQAAAGEEDEGRAAQSARVGAGSRRSPDQRSAAGTPGSASVAASRRKPAGSGPPAEDSRPVSAGASGRARISSIPKSDRPDLSWVDDGEELLLGEPEPPRASSSSQSLTYGVLGLAGGAVIGALFSIVLASAVATDCFADSCIFNYLSICSGIGAVGGVLAGLKLASQASGGTPSTEA